jgi:hypothetical protein
MINKKRGMNSLREMISKEAVGPCCERNVVQEICLRTGVCYPAETFGFLFSLALSTG